MKIKWRDSKKPEWEKEDDQEKFIKKFEEEIWPDYYELLSKQSVNALAVNTYVNVTDGINTRIDFEIEPGNGDDEDLIHIYVFPWCCVHKPESIAERDKKDENDPPWLIGVCDRKR